MQNLHTSGDILENCEMKNAKQESTGKIGRDGKSAGAVPPLLHGEVFAVNSKSINIECVMCPNCS